MPEGHTIHRIALDHQREFAGQRHRVTSPQGRFAEGAQQLDGRRLTGVSAHGKHLFYAWEDDVTLHVHLGLYGKFRRRKAPMPEPRGQIRLRVEGESHGFDLHGPNQCELLRSDEVSTIRSRLGPDPLDPSADWRVAWQRISRSRAAIGTLLLNQSVIAGIGNIYRAEILFATGIHPNRTGRSLSEDRFQEMWNVLCRWMAIGVRNNRIITADARQFGKPPSRLNRQERFMVYKKSHCPICGVRVESWECGARTVYACRACQPLHHESTTSR